MRFEQILSEVNKSKERKSKIIYVNNIIKEIETYFNELDNETKELLMFNYIGSDVLDYFNKPKYKFFKFYDAMIFRKKYFIFGGYIIKFKWATAFKPTMYFYKTSINKLSLKSLEKLCEWLEKYKEDINNLLNKSK